MKNQMIKMLVIIGFLITFNDGSTKNVDGNFFRGNNMGTVYEFYDSPLAASPLFVISTTQIKSITKV